MYFKAIETKGYKLYYDKSNIPGWRCNALLNTEAKTWRSKIYKNDNLTFILHVWFVLALFEHSQTWVSWTSNAKRFILFWNVFFPMKRCLFDFNMADKADNNFWHSPKNHPSAYNKIHYEYVYWMTQKC